jgi:signal transduction protein with GAF and PtsI domain
LIGQGSRAAYPVWHITKLLYNDWRSLKIWNAILLEIKPDNSETELMQMLKQICESAGWKYGEMWVPKNDLLQCHPAYYMADEKYAEFRQESETFTFGLGAGLPGRVWLTQQKEWIENASLEPSIYYRSHLAKKVGLKAALGVPIIESGSVLAVVVFYNDIAEHLDEKGIGELSDRIKSLICGNG